jgi:hypothetical protein
MNHLFVKAVNYLCSRYEKKCITGKEDYHENKICFIDGPICGRSFNDRM